MADKTGEATAKSNADNAIGNSASELDVARAKLRSIFEGLAPEKHSEGWNGLWKENVTPWDRNGPSPALIDALDEKKKWFGEPRLKDGARKTALVPGCGKGYDVLLFASYGYDAYGLDISELAIERAKANASDEADILEKYPESKEYGRGKAEFILGDFFKDDLLKLTDGKGFDVIYDYTFLCALPASMRPSWAKRMTQLLAPDGNLVCLEFPLGKEPRTGGPPHGLNKQLYEQLLDHPGREVAYNDGGWVIEDRSLYKADDALEKMDRWFAERTHPVGQGKDHVSIWRHIEKSPGGQAKFRDVQ